MARVLVNGLKSKIGGGKGILRTYLRLLNESSDENSYYALVPNTDEYEEFSSPRVRIVDTPSWCRTNLATIPLYHYFFPKILQKYDIDKIVNFGDIVIPTAVPQLYLFDWPFAAYPESSVWFQTSLAEGVYFRAKMFFFKLYLPHRPLILVQTDVLKARMEDLYGLREVQILPNAVSLDNFGMVESKEFGLPIDRKRLLYLTAYYPHKNLEIFLDVARCMKARGSDFCLVTTVAADQHPRAAAFLKRIEAEALGDHIVNVGPVDGRHIASLYGQVDGLLMPTLLESFSGSYVEAMYHRKPIFTSDRDFARAVCGDAATYFDPLNADAILATISDAFSRTAALGEQVDRGAARLAAMWDWDRVFAELQRHLARLA